MKTFIAHIKVFIAMLTNNKAGKNVDAYGRTYRSVYKKYGHQAMVYEYLHGNSWIIK